MFGSGEFLATAVTPSTYAARLYEAVLGRPPAGPEFERLRADVLEQMNSLLPGLVGSPEFAALQAGSAPTDYVVRLYEQALGRTPGPAELAALTPRFPPARTCSWPARSSAPGPTRTAREPWPPTSGFNTAPSWAVTPRKPRRRRVSTR